MADSMSTVIEHPVDQGKQEEPIKTYRLLHGIHCQDVLDGRMGSNGLPLLEEFRTGAIVKSRTDLCKLNAQMEEEVERGGRIVKTGRLVENPAYPRKFERIWGSEGKPGEYAPDLGPITAEEAARRGFATAQADSAKYPASQGQSKQAVQSNANENVADYVARLEKMSVKDLLAHAADEEVDVKAAGNSKEAIIKVLRASASK